LWLTVPITLMMRATSWMESTWTASVCARSRTFVSKALSPAWSRSRRSPSSAVGGSANQSCAPLPLIIRRGRTSPSASHHAIASFAAAIASASSASVLAVSFGRTGSRSMTVAVMTSMSLRPAPVLSGRTTFGAASKRRRGRGWMPT
jgi:hypothetical protein